MSNEDKERYNYIWGLYIGRFQPFHNGHLATIKSALKESKYLIILIGSHNKTIDYENPWTSEERREMILASLDENERERIHFQYIEDRLYSNTQWFEMAQEKVDSVLLQYSRYRLNAIDPARQVKMFIIGFNKDESSFYLNAFPKLDQIEMPAFTTNDNAILNATDIRQAIYENRMDFVRDNVPFGTYNWLINNWLNTDKCKYIKDFYEFDKHYEEPYLNQPYAVNFYTADSVIICNSHVLLIKRKGFPYKECWALPGGHVNANETAYKAALRELSEETTIQLSETELNNAFKFEKLFDNPNRSKRCRVRSKKGRTVTIAHYFHIENKTRLPKTMSSDDAIDSKWVPLSDIKQMRNQLMEDHADIIEYGINRIN